VPQGGGTVEILLPRVL